MNKSLNIRNFKCLQDIELEIKPLTFLFGKNGTGKSSLIQALLFLSHNIQKFQSEREYERRERINTSFYSSDIFDLINFNEAKSKYSNKNDTIYGEYL